LSTPFLRLPLQFPPAGKRKSWIGNPLRSAFKLPLSWSSRNRTDRTTSPKTRVSLSGFSTQTVFIKIAEEVYLLDQEESSGTPPLSEVVFSLFTFLSTCIQDLFQWVTEPENLSRSDSPSSLRGPTRSEHDEPSLTLFLFGTFLTQPS